VGEASGFSEVEDRVGGDEHDEGRRGGDRRGEVELEALTEVDPLRGRGGLAVDPEVSGEGEAAEDAAREVGAVAREHDVGALVEVAGIGDGVGGSEHLGGRRSLAPRTRGGHPGVLALSAVQVEGFDRGTRCSTAR
jgi:hypothetical protein